MAAGVDTSEVRCIPARRARRRRSQLLAAVLLVVLVLAALAAPAVAGRSAPETPESCGLLRVREIERALGQRSGRGVAGYGPGLCQWRLRASGSRPAGTLAAYVARGTVARPSYALAAEVHAAELQPLAGLGRKAFFAPSLGTVWVLVDPSTVLFVQGAFPPDATPDDAALRDALVALAGVARARV